MGAYPDEMIVEARMLFARKMTIRAIAEQLGVPVGTVNGWVHYYRQAKVVG